MFDREAIFVALLSLTLALWILLASGIASAQDAGPGVEIDEVDLSEFPEVTLSVTGPSALAGVPLTAEEIFVTANGEPRDVVVTPKSSDDLDVILLIDTSGSMSGAPIEQARSAAKSFIERMPPTTSIAVVGFGVSADVATAFTTDSAVAASAVDALVVGGETALYDAVVASMGEFEPGSTAQRRLVIVSDGGDTASGAPIDVPLALISNSDVQVQVISLLTAESDRPALASLAAAGRGRVVEASDPEALSSVFDAVASALVSQYDVSFTAENGGSTEVRVTVRTLIHESSATTTTFLPSPVVEPMPTPEVSEPVAAPAPTAVAATAAPILTLSPQPTATWLFPAGLAAMFVAMVVLFRVLIRPGRRQNVLRSWSASSAETTKNLTGWVRGTPGLLSDIIGSTLSRRGRERRLELALARAGIEFRPTEFVLFAAVGVAVAVLLGILAGGLLVAIVFAALTYAGIRLALHWLGRRRQQAFAGQLHGVLTMMAGSLRSGYSLSQSVNAVAGEVESPAAEEFNRALVEVQLGRDLGDAFNGIADRVDSDDFRWVVEAIDISRTVGGNLGEVLDNVAKTIRDRDRVSRQVRTLSAEGRLSAMILTAMPFAMAAYLQAVNPEYLAYLTDTGLGRVVMAGTLIVVAFGVLWMRKIVKPEF